MKRYTARPWLGFVRLEGDEYGDLVRYRDALAYFSYELDRAYAAGQKVERERCATLCESLKGGDSSYAVAYYDNALDDAAAAIRGSA